jgi:hypothetical protein
MKLFIATPCYRSDPEVAVEWGVTVARALGLEATVRATVNSILSLSQAQMVEAFLGSDCELFFSREDDIFVEPDVLGRMIAADVPAIVAPYFVRGTKRLETILDADDAVLWAGLGCALLKREVLVTLRAAYRDELRFVQEGVELVHLFRDFFADRDDGRQLVKGDHAFWWRVRTAGYRVEALDDVIVNHAGQISRSLRSAERPTPVDRRP